MSLSFNQKMDNFTIMIDESAAKLGCIFIQDSGEGHDLETETLYLEDVSGWLVPVNTLPQDSKKDEFYRFAEWRKEDSGEYIIEFVKK